jgi:hypothetical protein
MAGKKNSGAQAYVKTRAARVDNDQADPRVRLALFMCAQLSAVGNAAAAFAQGIA